jgi:hypothetical protein
MHLKSIVFDCPIIYRGIVQPIKNAIHAMELNEYIKQYLSESCKLYVIVVSYNEAQYVISASIHMTNKTKMTAIVNNLSAALNASVSILRVIHDSDEFNIECISSSDNTEAV